FPSAILMIFRMWIILAMAKTTSSHRLMYLLRTVLFIRLERSLINLEKYVLRELILISHTASRIKWPSLQAFRILLPNIRSLKIRQAHFLRLIDFRMAASNLMMVIIMDLSQILA